MKYTMTMLNSTDNLKYDSYIQFHNLNGKAHDTITAVLLTCQITIGVRKCAL